MLGVVNKTVTPTKPKCIPQNNNRQRHWHQQQPCLVHYSSSLLAWVLFTFKPDLSTLVFACMTPNFPLNLPPTKTGWVALGSWSHCTSSCQLLFSMPNGLRVWGDTIPVSVVVVGGRYRVSRSSTKWNHIIRLNYCVFYNILTQHQMRAYTWNNFWG